MTRSTLAGIALAGAIVMAAWPAGSQTATPPTQPGSPQPTARDEGAAGAPGFMGRHGGPGMGLGRGEMMGMGPERHEMMRMMMGMGPERREMMHRMMHGTPQERCMHFVARRAGMVAYTVTMLNLTAEQRPLWDKLNDVLQQNLQKAQQLCAGLAQTSGEQTVLDRLDRAERFLSARLQALQQIRPPLEQLYQALSPAQKQTLNQIISHRQDRL